MKHKDKHFTSISRLLLGESWGVAAVVVIIGVSLKERIFPLMRLSLIEKALETMIKVSSK